MTGEEIPELSSKFIYKKRKGIFWTEEALKNFQARDASIKSYE